MNRPHSVNTAHAILLASLLLAGCSSSGIVGEWKAENKYGKQIELTILSDGTGDFTRQGDPTLPVKWKRVKDGYEIDFGRGEDIPPYTATLRENGSLAIRLSSPEEGLLICKRKTADH